MSSPSEPASRAPAPGLLETLIQRWDIMVVIAAGGALGSVARWGLALAVPHAAEEFPLATWIANVTGALAIGALMVLVVEVWPPRRWLRPFWGVGVLGGYTTFSTYMLDTYTAVATGHPFLASGYLIGTLLTGLVAAWLGASGTRAAVAAARRRPTRRQPGPDQ